MARSTEKRDQVIVSREHAARHERETKSSPGQVNVSELDEKRRAPMPSAVMEGWQKRLLEVIQTTPGLTMRSLSKNAGLNPGYVSEMFTREMKPTIEVFLAIATAAGVSPAWLLTGETKSSVKVPIIGTITSAETWAETLHRKRHAFDLGIQNYDLVGIEVRGDSMAPVYRDRDLLLCQRRAGDHVQDLVGLDCVVQTATSDRYLKILRKGTSTGLFTLRSYNPLSKDIENVALAWAAPVLWIRRSAVR